MGVADLGKIPIELGLMTETGYPPQKHHRLHRPLVNPSTTRSELRGVFANPDYGCCRAVHPGAGARRKARSKRRC